MKFILLGILTFSACYNKAMEQLSCENYQEICHKIESQECPNLRFLTDVKGGLAVTTDSTANLKIKLFKNNEKKWKVYSGGIARFSHDGEYVGVINKKKQTITTYKSESGEKLPFQAQSVGEAPFWYNTRHHELIFSQFKNNRYSFKKMDLVSGKLLDIDNEEQYPLAYFPHSESVLTFKNNDDTAKIYSIKTREVRDIKGFKKSKFNPDNTAVFSINEKDEMLGITFGDSHEAKVWNITRNDIPLMAIFEHPKSEDLRGIAFNEDGTQLVTGYNTSNSAHLLMPAAENSGLKIWDITTQKLVNEYFYYYEKIKQICFVRWEQSHITVVDYEGKVFTLDPRAAVAAHVAAHTKHDNL